MVIAEQDADLAIALLALDTVKAEPVTAVAEEKNIIVLYLYHFLEDHEDVFFTPQPKWTSVKEGRCWNRHLTLLGRPSCNNLLLMQAVSGSDTLSSLYGIG